MREPRQIPTAMVPVKELGLHAKVQSLQALFMTLTSSLQPVLIHGADGPEEIQSKIGQGVKTSIETALIHTCNRICSLMQDERNWVDDDGDARELLGMLMNQAVADMEKDKTKKRQPRKQKGTDSDEQK